MHSRGKLGQFVLDEVHCVKEWGDTFRKPYSLMCQLKGDYPGVPLLGLTATASMETRKVLMEKLKCDDYIVIQNKFNRENLVYTVNSVSAYEDRTAAITELIKTQFVDQCGIIYCQTKKRCEELGSYLRNRGVSADYFHAGRYDKQQIQQQWT